MGMPVMDVRIVGVLVNKDLMHVRVDMWLLAISALDSSVSAI